MLRVALAAVHLLSLALGVFSLTARARALAAAERDEDLKPKGSDYYLSNHVFWTKMLLLAALLVLEGILATTFVRWRIRLRKKVAVSLARKTRLVRFHWAEFWLLLGMIVMATLMARGVGVVNAKRGAEPSSGDGAQAALERDLATGARVYRRYCVTCHQVDGRGLDGKLAADFRADARRLTKPDDVLEKSVADGVPGSAMRAFRGELDDAEIRGVVAYVRKSYGGSSQP